MKYSLRNYTTLILRRKRKSPWTKPGPPGGTLPRIIVYVLGVFFLKTGCCYSAHVSHNLAYVQKLLIVSFGVRDQFFTDIDKTLKCLLKSL